MRYRKLIEDMIAIGLIFLWSYAAAIKLLNHERFIQEITWFPLLGRAPSFIAIAFPVVIILIAIMLAVEKTRLKGLIASALLLIIMTVYLTGVINFAEKVPCSCSSIWKNIEWKENILINLGLIILNLIAILLRKGGFNLRLFRVRYKTHTS